MALPKRPRLAKMSSSCLSPRRRRSVPVRIPMHQALSKEEDELTLWSKSGRIMPFAPIVGTQLLLTFKPWSKSVRSCARVGRIYSGCCIATVGQFGSLFARPTA